MSNFTFANPENTLEPPGSIAILGAGPLALETALYGRYLGFSVTIIAPHGIVPQLQQDPNAPAPSLFATPLGLAAIAAQRGLGGTIAEVECPDHESWRQNYFQQLLDVDFLKGSIRSPAHIESIAFAEAHGVEDQSTLEKDDQDSAVPPDFIIEWTDGQSNRIAEQFEAIIDMRSTLPNEADKPASWFPTDTAWLGPQPALPASPPDYYLLMPDLPAESLSDTNLAFGFENIRRLFEHLCGRPHLDVYTNLGGFANR